MRGMFNPIRWLAMNLIEKNQDRKENEKLRRSMEEKSLIIRESPLELATDVKPINNECLPEIQSETEEEETGQNKKPVNVDIITSNRKRKSPSR